MFISNRLLKRITLPALLLVGVIVILNSVWFWRLLYPLPHQELILKEAKENNVDPLLVVSIIRTESNFSTTATSKRGALGLMQIMPETGRWIAEKRKENNFNQETLFQPDVNIRYGTWYLADLKREFNDDLVLVIAAYNGGRGNVKEWIKKEQWTGEHTTLEQIPFPETRNYVKKVLRNYQIYQELYPHL